ncbi:MAG: hypothetical protein QOD77_1176 [Thermoplasmata archaeon]|jgi:replication factor A1|nr:hypothetical protein [Thermoplasmata archaeon]
MQTTPDLAPYLAALKKTLGTKLGAEVDEQDLRDELAKYLEYGVPIDQAVRTIERHHGVQPAAARAAAPVSQERVPLASLPPASPFVNLKVRLLSVSTKAVTARGETKDIVWGLLGDETGTAPYTSWRPLEGLQKGDVLQVEGAYTKAFNGQVQVNFGDRTKVAKLDEADLPQTPVTFRDMPIADLKDGVRGIRVTARILDIQPRQLTVQGTQKTVWSGALADASGRIEFTAWADPGLAAGQAVTIEGGYIRAYRGVAQLNFDTDARISPAATEVPPAELLAKRPTLPIREVLARNGGSDLHVVGTLLEVRPGSGLVQRCSTAGCTRVLAAGMCRIHNQVAGVPDVRLKAILDDGTGAVNLVAGRAVTEQLLGKTLEEVQKETLRPDLAFEVLKAKLTGRVFAVRGNALSDEYGVTYIVQSMARHAEDAKAAAAALLEVA